jgi:uncharacterized protein YndB with AHSA1/START domain
VEEVRVETRQNKIAQTEVCATGDKMKRAILGFVAMVAIALGFAGVVSAEVKSAEKGKFRVEQELILPATPNEVYDAITGDISAWWDHSFSGHPKKLYIEARPGGGFYEIFDDAGNGALHATVIYADRGKKLRYTGPLGFAGNAIDLVTTYDLSVVEGGTKFHLTVTATGDVNEQLAGVVDSVWHHFLDERLKPYITSGDYKTHGKTGGGAAVKENVKDNAPASEKIVLDNAKANGEVKRITLTLRGKDAFSPHIDLVAADGKAGVIDSDWKRRK